PCSMRVNLARLVFSQSCSWLRSVVCRRLSIIVLMLSFSSATSPRASTWIDRVRSHLVGQVRGEQVDVARQVLPGTGRAGHVGLAAEAAFDADFTRDVGHLLGE